MTLYKKREEHWDFQERGMGCCIVPESHIAFGETLPEVGKMYYMANLSSWWRTNVISEIVESDDSLVIFKTKSGSTYKLEL